MACCIEVDESKPEMQRVVQKRWNPRMKRVALIRGGLMAEVESNSNIRYGLSVQDEMGRLYMYWIPRMKRVVGVPVGF